MALAPSGRYIVEVTGARGRAGAEDGLGDLLASNSGSSQVGTPSGLNVQQELENRPLSSELLSLGDPILVSASTALDDSAVNGMVIASPSSNIVINLPAVSGTVAVKILIQRGSTGRVGVQAAAGSGLNVDNRSLIYMLSGESATFLFLGAMGWVRMDQVSVPLSAELVSNGSALTLPVGSFTPIALVGGTQLATTNLQALWLADGYFTAPRAAVYEFDLHLWLNLTGGPADVDVGYYVAASPTGSPDAKNFDRLRMAGTTNTKATYSSRARISEGAKLIPVIRPLAPLTAAELSTLVSKLAVSEIEV